MKQLLYTLTVTDDGGVPVYFGTASGNVVDDTTHRDTWDLLRELVGKPDFLYVADCKLSSQENLAHIAQRGGRFVTVLPASRREDGQFRQRLRGKLGDRHLRYCCVADGLGFPPVEPVGERGDWGAHAGEFDWGQAPPGAGGMGGCVAAGTAVGRIGTPGDAYPPVVPVPN